jgi:dolichol kinase
LLPAAVVLIGKPHVLYGLVPLAVTALCLDVLRSRSAAVNRFIDRAFGWMMRAGERPNVGDPVAFNGATWVITSIAVLTILFPVDVAVVSFCIFMLGDAAAALFGRKFGRHAWGGSGRTIEGSAAFLVTGVVTGALLAGPGVGFAPFQMSWAAIVAGAATAAALEVLPVPVNDNLAAPLGTAIVLLAILSRV